MTSFSDFNDSHSITSMINVNDVNDCDIRVANSNHKNFPEFFDVHLCLPVWKSFRHQWSCRTAARIQIS